MIRIDSQQATTPGSTIPHVTGGQHIRTENKDASLGSPIVSSSCPQCKPAGASHARERLIWTEQPQINDALRKFGISPSTKRLILIRIGTPTGPTPSSSSAENNDLAGDETFDARKERYEQELVDQMAEVVEGEMVSLDRLGEEADWKSLKKVSIASAPAQEEVANAEVEYCSCISLTR